ncbi:hypothetical protein CR513_48487, partial [Mucuna pruriens]
MKRGDIVWARLHFPHKWCPALVLASDTLGVQLSFSFSNHNHHHQNDVVSPTYFVQSQLLPFEDAFPSIVSRHNDQAPLIHSALRFFGQRLISGLRCRCLVAQTQAQQARYGSGSSSEFDPAGLLCFVLDAAVSPWVEAPRFAHAVRVVAQVHAFRSYCSLKHKKIYKQIKETGDNVNLLPSSSLGQTMHSVTEESVALERKEKSQIISKNGEKSIAISAIGRLKSTVPDWEGNSEHLFKNKHLIISETLMHSSALDAPYMVRESLKSELRGDNVKLLPCSSLGQKMQSVTQESVALEPQKKCQIISKNEESNIAIGAIRRLNSTFPVWEENSEHLFKNKQLIISENLMHSPALDPYCMVRESLKSERQRLLKGIVDTSFGKCSTMSRTHTTLPSNFKTHLSNYMKKRKDNALELCCKLPDTETIIYFDRKRRRLDKRASCHDLPQIGGVQESERDAYISKHTRPRISHIKMVEPEGSIQKHHQASTCLCETTVNFTDDVQKVDPKRSQNCESLSNLAIHFHTGKSEVGASEAKVKGILGSDSSVYQERLEKSCNSDTPPLKSKKSARTELSSGDCLMEGKDCYRGVASCSIFNSKVGQLSQTHDPFSPKSLYMKFPKNFNLPSKEQLMKKFSVFGSVDSSRTRVSFYTGSAQVTFLKQAEAVAAYQYAKTKVLFGEANVRFWLDPFEHKRRGFESSPQVPSSASKQIGPPLKSCLKNSNSFRQENRKKRCRVRFTIET